MNGFLKCYKVKITALAPIHVGSGQKIGKKEYIYMPWNQNVIVPEIEKMYADIRRKGLEEEFAGYMMDAGLKGPSLSQWLKRHGMKEADYERWKKYKMEAGEAFVRQEARPKEIVTFIKDAYGMPYVPGSSLKGMIRTALIARELLHHPEKYERIRRNISLASTQRKKRKEYLSEETSRLEQQIFYLLGRDEKKLGSVVNDILAGIHVGDSDPISVKNLALCQKIDYTLDGKEKPLPILRECLIPGTEICFDVSIDTSLLGEKRFPYQMKEIIEALNEIQTLSYCYFYSRFHRGSSEKDIVWLGGGCGFLSKTVVYALFGNEAVPIVDNIFKNTLGRQYENHKHMKDKGLKLAPHACKCTRYQGILYDMGMGRIEYEEV